jgi:hypothetical protein
METEHTVSMYFIRYLDPISKKWVKTRWRMTEEDAAKRYEGQEYEVVQLGKEDRVVGYDPIDFNKRNGFSRFHTGTPGRDKLK